MATEAMPPAAFTNGNGLVLFVATIADPTAPTVAELTDASVKNLTYSIEGAGYKHDVSVNSIKIDRLTATQVLQGEGIVEDTLDITYANTATSGDTARVALNQGTVGFIVERWGIPNGTAIAAAQIITVVPFKAGLQKPDAPVKDSEFTITQNLLVTGAVQRNITVHA